MSHNSDLDIQGSLKVFLHVKKLCKTLRPAQQQLSHAPSFIIIYQAIFSKSLLAAKLLSFFQPKSSFWPSGVLNLNIPSDKTTGCVWRTRQTRHIQQQWITDESSALVYSKWVMQHSIRAYLSEDMWLFWKDIVLSEKNKKLWKQNKKLPQAEWSMRHSLTIKWRTNHIYTSNHWFGGFKVSVFKY